VRILWVLPYLPWPTTSGGKTRQYHLLRSLATKGHRITLLAQSKTPLDAEARDALEPMLERLIVLPRRPVRHPLTLLYALLAPWPLLATVNGASRALRQQLEQLLDSPWDIVQIEHSYAFQPCAGALAKRRQPFVLTEHNLESSLGTATYARLPAWLAPFAHYDQWRARLWERKVFSLARRVIAVTPDDAVAMKRLTTTPVDVVVNGVDTQAFSDVQADSPSSRVLFVGNYEYAPNVDAIQWALDEIFPLVWRQCPLARFVVAGYAMPAHWAQRWPDERIEWLGFVPDLPKLQARCALFFAPLRHGGGSKLKVLEALAGGLPLVTTAQGASGLGLRSEEDYLVGENPEQLAAALTRLLQQPDFAARLATNGRNHVRTHHDWQTVAAQIETVYLQAQTQV
jgi:glycosyltransferase involved in cell wall biosynthesis